MQVAAMAGQEAEGRNLCLLSGLAVKLGIQEQDDETLS